jgi:hypothetical protein
MGSLAASVGARRTPAVHRARSRCLARRLVLARRRPAPMPGRARGSSCDADRPGRSRASSSARGGRRPSHCRRRERARRRGLGGRRPARSQLRRHRDRGVADRRGERLGTVVWRESSPVPDGDGRSSTSRPSSGRASSVTFANADTVGAGRSSTASRSPRGLRQRRRAWRATSTCADRVPETA